ncbi:hypothetical protein [Mesorhizobium sp. B2-8-3]
MEPFDPSLFILAMFASVDAIFLSTFILINQNAWRPRTRPGQTLICGSVC